MIRAISLVGRISRVFARGNAGEEYLVRINITKALRVWRGELKDAGKKKPVSFGKRVLEIGFIKKILLAVYNRIFSWYYS